ncbi:MAG: N-acetylneuraminate synthase family protein [Planctomycetota bacterium]
MIAEIGINHNGDLALAKKLIDVAKAAGCDAVKFQKRTIDVVYSREFLDSPRESPWGTTQREQKQHLEFGEAEYREIDAHCREIGIDWFASAWDVASQRFLRQFGLRYNKIASAMLPHAELLEAVAAERKLTFISTGMSTAAHIQGAVGIFRRHGCPFVLMHCISEYPAPERALQLDNIYELRKRYRCPVGYSGHEATVTPTVLAAMMGAVAIERHLSLDRAMYGSDQAASLIPSELSEMVRAIRTIPIAVGDGGRQLTAAELANAKKLRYWAHSQDRELTRKATFTG